MSVVKGRLHKPARIGVLLAVVAGFAASAAPRAGADENSFILRAGVIWTGVKDETPIKNGIIIVRNGVIVAVGAHLDLPADLPLYDEPHAQVFPGLIAAATDFAGGHQGDESIAGGYVATDEFDRFGDYRPLLQAGVTTVHLSPGRHRLVTGVGGVVRLAGPPDERVLAARTDVMINWSDGADHPPALVEYAVPPSADNAIKPALPQRPAARIGRSQALTEALAGGLRGKGRQMSGYDFQAAAFDALKDGGLRWRFSARQATDILSALGWLQRNPMQSAGGIIEIAGRLDDSAAALRASGVPVIYRVATPSDRVGGDLGPNPRIQDPDPAELAQLDPENVALSVGLGMGVEDLGTAIAVARETGWSDEALLASVTRIPARILGVDKEIGTLEPEKRADLVIASGDFLSARMRIDSVFVDGERAYAADRDRPLEKDGEPAPRALVVRAGHVWLGPGRVLENGEVLIRDGRIEAVGRAVAVPSGAEVLDAGPAAWITPGLIDAYGHLGLEFDRGQTGMETRFASLIGAARIPELRAAKAGITAVALAPYHYSQNGGTFALVKTAGVTRDERLVRDVAGVLFDVTAVDPSQVKPMISRRLDAGKKYLETWKKYEKDLEEWAKKKIGGAPADSVQKPATEEKVEKSAPDPLTGIWDGRVFGGPLPQPLTGKASFTLTGTAFEGKVIEPPPPIPHRIVGTLQGGVFSGRIEAETPNGEYPEFEGTIDREDHMKGTIRMAGMGISVEFEGDRVEKNPAEFKVSRTKTTGKDGRPLPPKVDPALEPLKALLEKKITAIVRVRTAYQISELLDLFEEEKLSLTLLDADEAFDAAERLKKNNVGVILTGPWARLVENEPYFHAAALCSAGVAVAYGSDAEDGARTLPALGTSAVRKGLGPEAMLEALTLSAAKLLGVQDRLGALEPGKDGDLVVFSGLPFEAGSRVLNAVIDGEEVAQR